MCSNSTTLSRVGSTANKRTISIAPNFKRTTGSIAALKPPRRHPVYDTQERLPSHEFEARKARLIEKVRRKSMVLKIQRWFRHLDKRDNRSFKNDEARRWYDHFSMDQTTCRLARMFIFIFSLRNTPILKPIYAMVRKLIDAKCDDAA